MRVLLIYPKYPKNFFNPPKTLEIMGKKAMMPSLSLITVAAILPQEWEFKLVDTNVVETVTQADWDWAELVIISGMLAQKFDMINQIKIAKQQGQLVAVGGPYPTALPQELEAAGADFLVLDEGEMTLPMFVEALAKGEKKGTFRSPEKPDVSLTPIPRFDLINFEDYVLLSLQFSRGCPFQCEFCDIIVLYGRKTRTKTPAQFLAEMQYIYDLGWRGPLVIVDDNFIGNKRNVKLLLREMQPWLEAHNFPFSLMAEASVDLAEDHELLAMMRDCQFGMVFLGIETPDEASLVTTKKFQNTRSPLHESIETIMGYDLMIMAGFILGFDGEKPGAAQRIVDLIEETAITQPLFSLLQAIPGTALWQRLERENRLLSEVMAQHQGHQAALMNFIPSRPIEHVVEEYLNAIDQIYDPVRYLDRLYRLFAKYDRPRPYKYNKMSWRQFFITLRFFCLTVWRWGICWEFRGQFWYNFWRTFRIHPGFGVLYIAHSSFIGHFLDFRQTTCHDIRQQLTEYQHLFQKQSQCPV
jgi:radical SAM superfamily enzyme YgiQ (UPF0313 family)